MEKLNSRLKKWITPKNLAIFLTIAYVISLIPLLWIGFYNYPSADDYSIGSNCRQVWVNSHNIFSVLLTGVVRAVDDWVNWMGYFTSNFLMALPPNTFGERAYVLTVWIMLGMLSFSTWYLLKAIFVKVFKADKYVSHCVIMLMLFVTVQCMVGRVEAFYWYSGAVNYMFVHSMSLFFYGLLISAVFDKGKKRIWDLAAAACLGFFVGGGNQMTALNVAVILLVACGFSVFLKKWKEYKVMFIPMGVCLLGFVLNVAAPGNWVRAEGANGMNPVKAVVISFYYCLDYCMNQWSGWPVAILIIALIPLFWQMTRNTTFRFQYPLVVVLFGYCVVSAMMTPPLFAVGSIEAARLQALTFTMYILVLTLCVGYVTGYVRKKWEEHGRVRACESVAGESNIESAGQSEHDFSLSEIWCLLGCFVFFAAAAVITVIPEPHYFTATSAITDLANGSAKAYGDARAERMKLYNSGEKDIEVEPLPAEPALLYFSDIGSDTEYWENRGLRKFYGLDSVRVVIDFGDEVTE